MRDEENRKLSKIICGIIVVVTIAGILYLTFQTSEQTTALSEKARQWLKSVGWEMNPREIRSNVHVPLFFLFGIAIFVFGHFMKWKWYVTLLFAISVAFIDEGIKVFLPTREFDLIDLGKDIIGLLSAGFLVGLISRFHRISRS